MWKDSLKKVIDEKKLYDEELNLGASNEEINKLVNETKEQLGKDIPNEYLDILSKVNGLEFNGFILYGIDENLLEHENNEHIYGLIDTNKIWYENQDQKKYLFLGESNISWYVYEYENKKFIELDNPSGRECTIFSSFYDIFEKLLEDAVL